MLQITQYKEIEDRLQSGQKYLTRIAAELEIKLRLLYHPYPTRTCEEKLELLEERFPQEDWYLGRVVKTLFAGVDDDLVGFVLPERDKRFRLSSELAKDVYKQFDLQTKEGEYWLSKGAGYIPSDMEPGTCTPIVSEEIMDKYEDHLFICDVPELNQQKVDISIGGKGEEARKTSMVIPYGSIYQILHHKFPGKIHKVKF